MKTRLEILREVKAENTRFLERLNAAIEDQENMDKKLVYRSEKSKNYAAAKRAALDLKNELTKLTQDAKYRYGR